MVETPSVIKKPVAQIRRVRRYGIEVGGKKIRGEPRPEDIAIAIERNELEERPLQKYQPQLVAAWSALPQPEAEREMRQYHASRIAFFYANGWTDPIAICVHDVLEDGAHRFLAAQRLGLSIIDCEIVPCGKCGNKKGGKPESLPPFP
jgi:hypothetical protein